MNYDADSAHDYDGAIDYEKFREGQDQRVRELEELMELAEASTANVDRLSDSVDRSKNQSWLAVIFISFLSAVLAGSATLIQTKNIQFDTVSQYVLVASLLLSLVFLISFSITIVNRTSRIKRLKRDLMVETDIHHRLLSMIDQQLQRVVHGGNYSPVHLAIIDIKVRRMMRY